jgi:hypothetical protein
MMKSAEIFLEAGISLQFSLIEDNLFSALGYLVTGQTEFHPYATVSCEYSPDRFRDHNSPFLHLFIWFLYEYHELINLNAPDRFEEIITILESKMYKIRKMKGYDPTTALSKTVEHCMSELIIVRNQTRDIREKTGTIDDKK